VKHARLYLCLASSRQGDPLPGDDEDGAPLPERDPCQREEGARGVVLHLQREEEDAGKVGF
jgi:hypothetical protein